jgi:hypothetical protein
MRSASYQSGSDRRRAISLALTVLAHILIILLLLRLGPGLPVFTRPDRTLKSFDVTQTPDRVETKTTKGETKPKVAQASGGAPRKSEKPTPEPPRTSPDALPPPPVPLPATKSLFELGDISKLPRHAGDTAVADTSNGSSVGSDSGAAYGPGEGPGGERLYYAEWYSEPQHSQLSPYLPPNIEKGSWGQIACKTIPDNRVDNCRSMGESPLGSGISRGLREAAWQFRVRPPRIGGKPIIGAWVRILISFSEDGDPSVRSGRR